MKRIQLIILFLSLLNYSFACTCSDPVLDRVVPKSKVILIGNIIQVDTVFIIKTMKKKRSDKWLNKKNNINNAHSYLRSTVVLEKVYKGLIDKDTIVFFSPKYTSGSCAVPVYSGMKIILIGENLNYQEIHEKSRYELEFVNQSVKNAIYTDICWLTQEHSNEVEQSINELINDDNTQ